MKLRIDRDVLTEAVTTTAKALPARAQIPVLAGLLLTADGDGQLTVAGFDYEVSTQVTASCTVGDAGSALVSGRLLAEITKALPNKPVDIAAVGAHLELVCGSARFTLPTMPVEDYPTLPDMPAAAGTVDAAGFAAAVAQVAVAAGRDESLPMMTGVRVEFAAGKLSLLATDRYRLAVRDLPWTPAGSLPPDAAVLVPHRVLADTAKQLGPVGGAVTLALPDLGRPGEGMVGFATGARRTTSRLLDGANYPPVRSLFPKEVSATARVPVAALAEVVRRVALVADRMTPVLLSFSTDGLVVEAGGTEDARASEAMDATYTGEPMTVGFNPQYLIDGLQAVNAPTAELAFVDAIKPAVISGVDQAGDIIPDYRYLIMPIRVTR